MARKSGEVPPNGSTAVHSESGGTMADVAPAPKRRYESLDGLRGVGALIVVLYHAMLVIPALSALYTVGRFTGTDPDRYSVEWWLLRTPLRLVWAGHEAVLLFFVLSGFVLTIPLTAKVPNGIGWVAYYARRLVRLYVPVWGALVFAFVLAMVVQRKPETGSTWLQVHPQPTWSTLVTDAWLLSGTSNLNSPLWSLRWEVWFSLLLPVMFFLLKLVRVERWSFPAVLVMCAVSGAAQTTQVKSVLPAQYLSSHLLQYMPVFGIGMVIALKLPDIHRSWSRLSGAFGRGVIGSVMGLAAVLLTVSPTYAGFGAPVWVRVALDVCCLLGVSIGIILALEAAVFKKFLQTPFMRWAGSRSFSIYLVHEPIVVAAALLTKSDSALPWLFWAVLAVGLALGVAELFSRYVELPAHRLSRRVGTLVDGSRRRRMA